MIAKKENDMGVIRYIGDCIKYAKRYPLKDGDFKIWIRNVLYVNAQPKYIHGRIITRLLDRRHQ